MVIGISAKIGHGKDTVGQLIQELTQDDWQIKKFAGKLKQIVSILTGCTVEQLEDQEFKKLVIGPDWGDMTYRKMMLLIGTEAMRDSVHTNSWVNALFADYRWDGRSMTDGWIPSYSNPDNSNFEQPAEPIFPNWIITDMRFKNEAQAIREKGGILIRIRRPNIQGIDHISETDLDDYQFDYVIENDGSLEDLKLKVVAVLISIGLKLKK